MDVTANPFEPHGRDAVEVMGESYYQATLELIAGGRTFEGAARRDHTAVLVPEPSNPHDAHAVRVILVSSAQGGQSGKVGYLSRDDAVAYRPVIDRLAASGTVLACRASIEGGWDRGPRDRGSFGAVLHMGTPAFLMAELDSGGRAPHPTPEPIAPVATGRHGVDDGAGHIFDVTECPSCGASQSPPPKRSGAKCKSCGQLLGIDRRDDGLCSLVPYKQGTPREGSTEHQAAWKAHWENNPEPLRQEYREWLRHYADLGLLVRVETTDDACPSCRTAQGVYAASNAPELPNPECWRGFCCCSYRPVMPGTTGC